MKVIHKTEIAYKERRERQRETDYSNGQYERKHLLGLFKALIVSTIHNKNDRIRSRIVFFP
jgi:hypothetical protein